MIRRTAAFLLSCLLAAQPAFSAGNARVPGTPGNAASVPLTPVPGSVAQPGDLPAAPSLPQLSLPTPIGVGIPEAAPAAAPAASAEAASAYEAQAAPGAEPATPRQAAAEALSGLAETVQGDLESVAEGSLSAGESHAAGGRVQTSLEELFTPVSRARAAEILADIGHRPRLAGLDLNDPVQRSWLAPIQKADDEYSPHDVLHVLASEGSRYEDASYWGGLQVVGAMMTLESAARAERDPARLKALVIEMERLELPLGLYASARAQEDFRGALADARARLSGETPEIAAVPAPVAEAETTATPFHQHAVVFLRGALESASGYVSSLLQAPFGHAGRLRRIRARFSEIPGVRKVKVAFGNDGVQDYVSEVAVEFESPAALESARAAGLLSEPSLDGAPIQALVSERGRREAVISKLAALPGAVQVYESSRYAPSPGMWDPHSEPLIVVEFDSPESLAAAEKSGALPEYLHDIAVSGRLRGVSSRERLGGFVPLALLAAASILPKALAIGAAAIAVLLLARYVAFRIMRAINAETTAVPESAPAAAESAPAEAGSGLAAEQEAALAERWLAVPLEEIFSPLSLERARAIQADLAPEQPAFAGLDLADPIQRSWLAPIQKADDEYDPYNWIHVETSGGRTRYDDALYWGGMKVVAKMLALQYAVPRTSEQAALRSLAAEMERLDAPLALYVSARAHQEFRRFLAEARRTLDSLKQ